MFNLKLDKSINEKSLCLFNLIKYYIKLIRRDFEFYNSYKSTCKIDENVDSVYINLQL